ncbi:hypothetical protein LZ32DRAFT_668533 [Colletotrichum eremochloae]|nr:hypothetical protein LZ32DRAFT_668533 [Colletotrichum eremochloae]
MYIFRCSTLAATMLVASTQVAGFCQEYTFSDGKPCTRIENGQFVCDDNKALVELRNTHVIITTQSDATAGVKWECGTKSYTYFVDQSSTDRFFDSGCRDPSTDVTTVISVFSAKPVALPRGHGQILNFTDTDPCRKEADGGFNCGDPDGGSIRLDQGNVVMEAGPTDTAIRVRCGAGSSVYFCKAGNTTSFTNPVCADGFTSANSVRSGGFIIPP